jgi:hypothetical protein
VYDKGTGVWSDLVYWQSRTAALAAAHEILVAPVAQPFLASINTTSLSLSHSTITLVWTSDAGPYPTVVELAAFSLVPGVTDRAWRDAAEQTTPFFRDVEATAARRVLTRGWAKEEEEKDSTLWHDVVYWTSERQARQAAVEFESTPAAGPFLRAMETASQRFSFTSSHIMLQQEFASETFDQS